MTPRSRRPRSLFATFLTSIAIGGSLLASGKEFPDVIWDANAEYPLWVEAGSVLTPEGDPDPRDFSDFVQQAVRDMLADRNGWTIDPQCDAAVTGSTYPLPRSTAFRSFEEASERAELIARFELGTSRHGIAYGGIPGTLFQATPLETYRGRLRYSEYFLFVPVGRFELAETRICAADPAYRLPDAGAQIVVFLPADSHDPVSQVLFPSQDTYVLADDSVVSVPYAWCPDCTESVELQAVLSLDALETRLRALPSDNDTGDQK